MAGLSPHLLRPTYAGANVGNPSSSVFLCCQTKLSSRPGWRDLLRLFPPFSGCDSCLTGNADSGGKHNQGNPQNVRSQQMSDLQPERSEQGYV